MGREYLINFFNIFIDALVILIFIRVIMSWFPNRGGRFMKFISDVTDPILLPIKKVVPPVGGVLDLTPLVAIILLNLIQLLINGIF